MPTVKSWVTPWALCLVLTAPSVFAAPVADIPAAPLAIPSAEKPVKSPTSVDIPLPTTFTRTEAGRALNLGQLEAIQAETVLYEAQLARAKALNELQRTATTAPWISLSIRHRLLRTIRRRLRGQLKMLFLHKSWRSPVPARGLRPCWLSATAIRSRCSQGIAFRVRNTLLNGSISMRSLSPGRTKRWCLFPLRGNRYV